jgi:hypothetical protein
METNLQELAVATGDLVAGLFAYYPYILAVLLLPVLLILGRKLFSPYRVLSRKYSHIESDSLDNNKKLADRFYSDAFQFRCKQGSDKYRQYVIGGFHFFYNFHNQALAWIDEVVTRCHPQCPSSEFILAIIGSKQFGQLFAAINYVDGLDSSALEPGSLLIAITRADAIELWSPCKKTAVCTLYKDNVELLRANKQNGMITARLRARLKSNDETISIRLQFPEYQYDREEGKLQQHDIYATRNYQAFQRWLKTNTAYAMNKLASFSGTSISGIEVDFGISAEELLDNSNELLISLPYRLKALEGRQIDACFRSRVRHLTSSTATEFYIAMCSGLGLVIILENNMTGKVIYNGDAGWMVYENQRSQIIANPCQQVIRIEKYITRLLKENNLQTWPLHSLVVFTANTVILEKTAGKQPLQCDVIKQESLADWFDSNQRQHEPRFTKQDYNHFALLLNDKQGKYQQSFKSIA